MPTPLSTTMDPRVLGERRRFRRRMVTAYLLFTLVVIVGHAASPVRGVIGELADVMMMAAIFWPYPLFLAGQDRLRDLGDAGVIQDITLGTLVSAVGLALVWAAGVKIPQWFPAVVRTPFRASAWSLVLWYAPLLALQVVAIVTALAMGHDVAE